MRRCQTFWQCWSFQMLLNPVTLSLWHAPALRSLTPRFAWRPRQRSATPCAPCRRGGSGQSRCSAGPARTAWRSRTGSGGWRAATPPGPAAAGTSWPSPANQDGGRLSKASTPIRRCCFFVVFFQNAGLTALRVRSHWDTISRIWVMISLLVLARLTLFSLTSTWHALQCSLASSACGSAETFAHFIS